MQHQVDTCRRDIGASSDPSGVYQPRRVGMMHACSTGFSPDLQSCNMMPKGHRAIKHCTTGAKSQSFDALFAPILLLSSLCVQGREGAQGSAVTADITGDLLI